MKSKSRWSVGETVEAHGYTISYQDFVAEELPDRQRFVAVVDVRRGDRLLGTLRPEKSFYWNVEQWVTEVAIRATPKEDLYVILAGFESDGLASFANLDQSARPVAVGRRHRVDVGRRDGLVANCGRTWSVRRIRIRREKVDR